jgi:hypothetical protein
LQQQNKLRQSTLPLIRLIEGSFDLSAPVLHARKRSLPQLVISRRARIKKSCRAIAFTASADRRKAAR